ncbi:TrbC/VirB2 family protein, partial [Bartonella florencae]|uniref:TrbC/VirB2 family protein n=1 Tax=Bartonella florencae TaxID=928210 RepID=UPI00056912A9
MKQLKNLRSKNSTPITAISTAITAFFLNYPVYVQAQNLDKAKTALETLQRDLINNIIPVAAAVILLCLAI